MQAVVPAAGEGTRLRPLTTDRPKALVDVAGRPLLAHGLGTLVELGVEELVIVVGYQGEKLRAHFGETFEDVPIHYVEQPEPVGLAHAVLQAEPLVDGDFVVFNGDNIVDTDVSGLLEHHLETNAVATLLIDEVTPARASQGGALVFDEDGEVSGIVEKPDEPPSTRVARGCHVLSPLAFHACHLVTPSPTGEFELSAALDLLLAAGQPVETVRLEGRCINVNTPDDIAAAEAVLDR